MNEDKITAIIDKVCEIDLDEWEFINGLNGTTDRYQTFINGMKVTFNLSHSGYRPFLIINGVEMFNEKTNALRYRLEDYYKIKNGKVKDLAIETIYSQIISE